MIMHPAYLRSLTMGAVLLAAGAVLAQGVSGPPNALQGFSQNRDQPVKIDAATLEVRDKSKLATFAGNVQVVQGDTTLRCKTLAVFYDGDSNSAAMKTAQPGPGGSQRIRRLEAKGDVRVTQKDQTATGELGIFDMASNTVTLTGNVLVTQGQSVLRGEKLTVNLTTGVSHIEGGKGGGGRVQAVFSNPPGQQNATPPKNDDAATTRGGATREGANQPQLRNTTRPSGLY
jgi:lipopolysaccharide export system protein LptA